MVNNVSEDVAEFSPLVTIVILNYNGAKYIQRCLGAVLKINYPNFDVIFVDNCSTDDSMSICQEFSTKIKIIQTEKNVGFPSGNNIGARYAREQSKYLLFLNVDTEVTPSFLRELVKNLELNSNIGAAQPKLLLDQDRNRIDSMGALLDIIGTVHNVGGGEKDINYSYPIRVFYAKGAALLVRKTLFEKINGFDDSFFLWRDEVDLCWRVQLCGYIILAVPMAIVYHHGSAIINRSVPNLTMEFYFIRNNIRMLIKNYSSSNLLKYLPLFLVVYGVLTLHKMVTAKKPQYSVVYLKAVCWNLINLRETMSERKKIQTYIRKVADQSLLGTVLFKSLFSLKSRIEIKIPKFETRASEIE